MVAPGVTPTTPNMKTSAEESCLTSPVASRTKTFGEVVIEDQQKIFVTARISGFLYDLSQRVGSYVRGVLTEGVSSELTSGR